MSEEEVEELKEEANDVYTAGLEIIRGIDKIIESHKGSSYLGFLAHCLF